MPDTPSTPDGSHVIRVDLEPVGRRAEVAAGQTLLEAAQSAGVELVAICGGGGSCGTCRVCLMRGELSPVTSAEEYELGETDIAAGYRLACQAIPLSDVRIDIPPESLTTPQRTQIEGREIDIALDPIVNAVDVRLAPPDLHDLRSDATRLDDALTSLGYSPAMTEYLVLTDLSNRLRAQSWAARLALRSSSVTSPRSHVVAVLPPESRLLGLAVDIGTTKLAAYLVDLSSGETLARAGAMNPQIAYGEDVIARIGYANDHAGGIQILHDKLVDRLNQMVDELCAMASGDPAPVTRRQVVEAVVVGNTAMHHLFAGLPVHQLGTSPYLPAISEPLDVRARDVGLDIAPGAYVYLPPNIAGYVGADHVSMLLATDAWQTSKTVVALDIGTNTEISLAHGGRLSCCSCASGPAFEGAHIHDGMRAAPGAIERVQIVNGKVQSYTIGGQAPVGICGSGILDALSEMLKDGVLTSRGVLRKDDPRVRGNGSRSEFVLAPASLAAHGRDILVTRSDVNEIRLAKGAIRAGVDVLLAEAGVTYDEIDEFIVAGAFGTYLDIGSAVRIGMFPPLSRDRFQQVGNAAGTGAKQMLVSAERRRAAAGIARRNSYIELTVYPDFADRFVEAMDLR